MRTFLCLIFVLWFCKNASCQDRYPSYQKVVYRFFNEYAPNLDDYTKISFQKRPTGWHVSTEEYSDGSYQEIDNVLFWDKTTDSFKSLGFRDRQNYESLTESVDAFLTQWDARFFAICPYYNYPGWQEDIINDFGHQPAQLPDTTLYALGRAYSSYATHMLSNQYGQVVNNQFELGPTEKLSKSQLKTYRHYQHGAIRAYQLLADRNPAFETIVGEIGTKASNEHLTSYINLMMFSSEKEALKELKDDLYNDLYLATARNYLSSLEPNAVLFTGGDNDTFPIWYLQAKHGIRRDVTVMVVSYLNMNRFIQLITGEGSVFAPLELSINTENYDASGPNGYLPIEDEDGDPIDVISYLQQINEQDEAIRYPLEEGYYNTVPATQVSISTSEFFDLDVLPKHLSDFALTPEMIIGLKSTGIEMRDLVILDFIATNRWQRPIYFNYTSLSQINLDLTGLTVQEGLCHQLLPFKKVDAIDHLKTYRLINEIYDWRFSNMKKLPSQDEKDFITNYRSIINNVVYALLEDDNKEKAEEVLTNSFSYFPKSIFPLDYSNVLQVGYLLRMDKTEQGEAMGAELFQQALAKLREEIKSNRINSYAARVNAYIITSLIDSFNEYGLKELATEYGMVYDGLMK